METENIWEVDSNCSVDEELSKELEELEKQEELQKEQPNIGFRNGSLKSSSNQTQATNGESYGGGKEFGGLVFKNTGVISVAHSHHLSDAYKRKKQRKLLGLSVTGVAADIARREKKRLQYHKMKSDPLFVAKRNEYRKKYRLRRKLLLKMRTAQTKNEDGFTSTFFDRCGTEGSKISYGDSRLLYNRLTSSNMSSSAASEHGNMNGRLTVPQGGNSVEGFHLRKDATSASSTKPVPCKAVKVEAPAAGGCDSVCDGPPNKTDDTAAAGTKATNLLGNLYRPPSAGGQLHSVRKLCMPRRKPADVVSAARFKHSQLLVKRASSKLIYYQSVLRRDRAIIEHLKAELWKLGKDVDVSQFKICNYRLKRLDNPAEDAMFAIDSAEDRTYRKYVEEILNQEGNGSADVLDDKTFMQQIQRMAEHPSCGNSRFPLIPSSGALVHKTAMDPSTDAAKLLRTSSPMEKKIVPTEESSSVQSLKLQHKSDSSGQQTKADSPFKKPVSCVLVRLEKAAVLKCKNGSECIEPSSPAVVKKRQIAMKSTRGNVPRKKPLLSPSESAAASPRPESEASDVSDAYDMDELVQKAFSEGKAFAQLRAKLLSNSLGTESEFASREKKKPREHSLGLDSLFSLSSMKKSFIENTALDRKKPSPKKIPKELVDEDYVPGGSARLSSPVIANDDVQVRDNDIYDLFVKFRQENELDTPGICETKSVSPKLRQEVVQFVENSTYLERVLFNCGTGDESAPADGTASVNSNAGHHGSYRDHFVGLLHKRFLATHLRDCSLKMFMECLPRAMERKGAFARRFSSCLSCGNAEILFENLVAEKIIDFNFDFEKVLVDRKLRARLMASLSKVTDLDRSLSCFSWLKSLKGNFARSFKSVQETVGSLVTSFKEELTRLDEHLDGVYVKYCVMRAALARCEQNIDEAMVHITWCENPKVYSRSASNHMTVDQNISMLSGYVWTARKEYCFASLSDQRDHSTSVLWSHLEDALHDIVLLGYSKLFIISDPPMNHFRNKANFYYMNEFAMKRNVQIRWLFSASYHTYLTADCTGLKIKELIEKNTQSNVKTFGSNPYQTSSELISMLRPLTDTSFYLARKEDIEANISSLPELQTIKGTQTFAEVLIAPGKFYVKLDSADEYWTKVLVVF